MSQVPRVATHMVSGCHLKNIVTADCGRVLSKLCVLNESSSMYSFCSVLMFNVSKKVFKCY